MPAFEIVPLLLPWFARHARDLPWRRTDDPYPIWVSEIMLQQTQVKTVLPYWERWMKALPNIRALARAKQETIHKLWEGLGYYSRVRNMQKAAQFIVTNHQGKFPARYSQVLELPGVGRYTAGAICSIAFNQPTPVVDGNVIRVLTRMFGIPGDAHSRNVNRKLWSLAEELVQAACALEHSQPDSTQLAPQGKVSRSRYCSELNQALMELGALVCTARQPRCAACPLATKCRARRQNRVQDFPGVRRRPPATPRRFAAFVFKNRGRFFVRQRPEGVVNAHLWEFPNVELMKGDGDSGEAALKALGIRRARFKPLCRVKHSITRYRITLDSFLVSADKSLKGRPGNGSWLSRTALQRLPFASAHRKILTRLFQKDAKSSGLS